jgi:hypothetical protein
MPERDSQGRLTRAGMEEVIRDRGGVLAGGEIHTDLAALPSAADLARGDEHRSRQVREGILGQMAHLQGELAKLNQPGQVQTLPGQQLTWSSQLYAPGGGQAQGVGATAHAAPPGDLSTGEREELERLRAERREREQQRQAIHHAEDVQEGAASAPAPEPPPLFSPLRDEPAKGKGKGK